MLSFVLNVSVSVSEVETFSRRFWTCRSRLGLIVTVLSFWHVTSCVTLHATRTRKLCYRKDDSAMSSIHGFGCPENFRDFLTTPTATILNISYGLLFRWIPWMLRQNLKPIALPVPEIIGVPQKLDSFWIRPRSILSRIFNGLLFGLAL